MEQKAEKLGEFAEKLKELDDEDKRINMSDEDAPVMKHTPLMQPNQCVQVFKSC